jgi:hypothetical protein
MFALYNSQPKRIEVIAGRVTLVLLFTPMAFASLTDLGWLTPTPPVSKHVTGFAVEAGHGSKHAQEECKIQTQADSAILYHGSSPSDSETNHGSSTLSSVRRGRAFTNMGCRPQL